MGAAFHFPMLLPSYLCQDNAQFINDSYTGSRVSQLITAHVHRSQEQQLWLHANEDLAMITRVHFHLGFTLVISAFSSEVPNSQHQGI